jgi:DNA-binding PadR family transcriptional regulator
MQLPLKPLIFHVLLSLSEEDSHGYGIKKSVAARSGGTIDVEPGTLYRLMARLLKDGLVAPSGARRTPDTGDERRRYYRITPRGRETLRLEAERMAALLDDRAVRALMTGHER